MVPLLLVDLAIFDFALVDVQQFAEIINLSKPSQTFYLCGFEAIFSFEKFLFDRTKKRWGC